MVGFFFALFDTERLQPNAANVVSISAIEMIFRIINFSFS